VNYAVALRGLAVGFGLPLVTFAILAILVERRAGPRWLPRLWAVAITLVAAFILLRAGAAGAAAVGGARALVLGACLLFGTPFAVAALAAWRVGVHRPKPRPIWLQSVAVVTGSVAGVVIGLVLALATEAWWSA
jgi:hypothetical protein